MTHPRSVQDSPPKIIKAAEDVFVTDIDDRTVLDAVGGLWNVNLGYSCQPIKDAITSQLQEMPYYSSFRGVTTDKTLELPAKLTEWFAPEKMARAFFTSGGSDSVETALRLARQYHKVRGDKDRYKFLSLKKGYHGTHFGGASVNGKRQVSPELRAVLAGLFSHHLSAPLPQSVRRDRSETPRRAVRSAARGRDRVSRC